MSTKCLQRIIIILPIFLSGCTARHIVVLPEDAQSLSDTQWHISQEPAFIVDPPDIIEEEPLLFE